MNGSLFEIPIPSPWRYFRSLEEHDYPTNPKQSLIFDDKEREREREFPRGGRAFLEGRVVITPDFDTSRGLFFSCANLVRGNSSTRGNQGFVRRHFEKLRQMRNGIVPAAVRTRREKGGEGGGGSQASKIPREEGQ